jgi:hypothetical protein
MSSHVQIYCETIKKASIGTSQEEKKQVEEVYDDSIFVIQA